MVGRVVEISTDNRHVSVVRGFLKVTHEGQEIGRVPFDEISAVIANAHGLTFSNNLLTRLSEKGIPAVLCGHNHLPVCILWPVSGHHLQTGRMADQVAASQPLKKNLWAQIIRAKILAQRGTLKASGCPNAGFQLLARKVRSGDPENVEAEAARRYWRLLFGDDFRRDKKAYGINAMLNYGYAILRATTARAVMGAGLHAGFGIHHSNKTNPMVLVDDLMEPFRPIIDLEVRQLIDSGIDNMTADVKTALVNLMVTDLPTAQGMSPVSVCLERLAQSLTSAFAGNDKNLNLPLNTLPLGRL